ncbi:NADH dehydrogenase [ubiquinone] 1 alpha subcomplex subunit 7 [Fopius arisanus]|uniref:NADH dehydrogenase [ubiquinone] 1 alpha subcomplex subunit 7 n=1 Tax=Fopius arisanus TaxID=64838 RepID=A0A9R1TEH1_9HYME|nr:PREDICTED: NADH dehydrogenase [ubiquinone] 1 alpha subcomplex subunit 7-like [Fopius arisanus]XP_011307558.1 PREDICTED: NADH dehydrogenase [ubiquinone] 1 alpha subcomplex subunit 7-like [Fopius arisanus]
MSGKIAHRDVGPLLQYFRDFMRGRKHVNHIRWADDIAARTQPSPDLPGGPYHKTTKIYYFNRDARRLVQHPEIIVVGKKQITAGSAVSSEVKLITPNASYLPKLTEPPASVYPDEIGG